MQSHTLIGCSNCAIISTIQCKQVFCKHCSFQLLSKCAGVTTAEEFVHPFIFYNPFKNSAVSSLTCPAAYIRTVGAAVLTRSRPKCSSAAAVAQAAAIEAGVAAAAVAVGGCLALAMWLMPALPQHQASSR
jgi:hypothetical protein